MADRELHPLVGRASEGELPRWAEASGARRAHMARVAELMGEWALELGLDGADVKRWTAAAHLHDVLRDAPPDGLRKRASPRVADLPDRVLHGPVAAERLREEGVTDEALLRAVAFHTLGHPDLDRLGRALFAADFLEPGRDLRNAWRARLRARMPDEMDDVVLEILTRRVEHAREKHGDVRPESVGFLAAMRERTAHGQRRSEAHG